MAEPVGSDARSQSLVVPLFQYGTLTTVGFGDITPVHPFARSLVMRGTHGQLYPAIPLPGWSLCRSRRGSLAQAERW